MYVQTCKGGYPNPVGDLCKWKELLGFRATVSDPTAASRIIFWDDDTFTEASKMGKIVPTTYEGKTKIADVKGIANADANLEVLFPESIKLRYGLSIATDNIIAGTAIMYVK